MKVSPSSPDPGCEMRIPGRLEITSTIVLYPLSMISSCVMTNMVKGRSLILVGILKPENVFAFILDVFSSSFQDNSSSVRIELSCCAYDTP